MINSALNRAQMYSCIIKYLSVFIILLIPFACQKEVDPYYTGPEKSDQKMWDDIKLNPNFSEYVRLMQETKMDTIFNKLQSYTLFVPDNSCFKNFEINDSEFSVEQILGYHILNSVLIISNIEKYRTVQTYIEKFASFEKYNHEYYFDGIRILDASPLYKDGVFYEISDIVNPRPSLYEYMKFNIEVLSDYVDSRDSIGFDPLLSVPIGFNESGQTIYDTVYKKVNLFERDFFPITKNLRFKKATLLLFSEEQYDNALDQMASNMGGIISDKSDIPDRWQNEILIPYFIENGIFNGELNYEDFFNPVKNVNGFDVEIDYKNVDSESKFICSNGVIYFYQDLEVPPKLYLEPLLFEGEMLARRTDPELENYEWLDIVDVSDYSKEPRIILSESASEESYLSVPLPRNSTELFFLEFNFENVLPGIYDFVWRAYNRPSGDIKFYSNDILIGSFDNSYFRNNVDGNPPVNNFNQKVFSRVAEFSEFGDVKIRVEYAGPGVASTNGICIDYIGLIPVK